jgi:hypothetical protein
MGTPMNILPSDMLDLRNAEFFGELQGLHREMIQEGSRVQADVVNHLLEAGQFSGKKIADRWRSEPQRGVVDREIVTAHCRVKELPSYPRK